MLEKLLFLKPTNKKKDQKKRRRGPEKNSTLFWHLFTLPPSFCSASELKRENQRGGGGGGCPQATPLLPCLLFCSVGGILDQTSWSSRSWTASRHLQDFLRAPSESSWAAKRNSFLSSVTEPRDKASWSSDTLTAFGLSCEEEGKKVQVLLHYLLQSHYCFIPSKCGK